MEVADYLTPLKGIIADIGVHTLEEEIHIERILRLYESDPPDRKAIETELSEIRSHGEMVRKKIIKALELSESGLSFVTTKTDIVYFSRLRPLLKNIENEHKALQKNALEMVSSLDKGSKEKARILERILKEIKESLNNEMKSLLHETEEFTENAAHLVKKYEQNVLHMSRLLILLALAIGLLIALVITKGLVTPVKALIRGTSELDSGNLDVRLSVTTKDEIGELTEVFNTMAHEIGEKERIKATFGQYLDPRIVDDLIRQTGDMENKNEERRVVTVLFSDVVKFSAISELLTPTGLVKLINRYLTLASEPITRHHGVVDKFLGDGIMAFWGPPFAGNEDEHAALACHAALEQFIQIEKLRAAMPDMMGFRKGLPEFNIRIGLATGEVSIGSIGPEYSKSYTIVGDTAKEAEYMESLNKLYGTSILLTEHTQASVKEVMETRKIDYLKTGINETPLFIFELLGVKGEVSAKTMEIRDLFESGLKHCLKGEWDSAESRFKGCLKIDNNDRPSKIYAERVKAVKESPSKNKWNGVWSNL